MKRPSTVYILGAGASAQYSGGAIPVPVVANFLRAAFESAIPQSKTRDIGDCVGVTYHPGLPQRFEALEQFVRKFWRLTDATRKLPSVEEVLSVIDLGRHRDEGIPPSYTRAELDSQYERLIELVFITLEKALKGPPCDLHQDLVASMGLADVVISFNWDILIDNALFLDQHNTGLFDASCGYGFRPGAVADVDGEYCNSDCAHTRGSVRRHLLKLHGSMNWLRCPECGSVFVVKAKKAPAGLPGEAMECPRDGQYMRRLIIPFTWNKQYDIHPYADVWRDAARFLSTAERVVVIGYSLADADFQARDLLLRARAANEFLKEVVLVDRAFLGGGGSQLREKYEKVFRIKIKKCFPDTRLYLDTTRSGTRTA